MASTIVITVKSEVTQALAKQRWQLESGRIRSQCHALMQLFRRAMIGNESLNIDVQTAAAAPVAAAGTITITNASVAANDTVTIAGTALTAKASGATGAQFNIGATATLTGDNLVAAILAHATLSKYFTASNLAGVVTVTLLQKGSLGNLIAISTSNGTGFALVQPTGGTGGAEEAAVNYSVGI